MNDTQKRLECSLFILRITVFIVMAAWTADKFINPDHAAKVFEKFYYLKGFGPEIMMTIGAAEALVLLAFVTGIFKRYSYGIVLLAHTVSTLSSWQQYFVDPNLLFFAAWPMLGACITLYLLRDQDKKLTLSKS